MEWLGDVPEHWEVVKSKRLFWCKGGFAFSSDDFFEEGNYPVIRISNIQDKSISTDKIVYVNSCTKKVFSQFSAYTGDLIFCMTGASLGKVGLLPKELSFALINQRVGRLDITSYAIKQFVFYLVSNHGFQTNIRMLGVGLTDNFPNISSDLIGIIDVVLPPLDEQQGIVNYLDTETARIDNLIAKQEKLIELLEEQRKSIISHAVTKGLNPNVPMKDSGVEWLGDVPEHWTVLKNRHIFNFSKGLSITKENLQESGIPCVSYGEVHSKFGFEFNPEIDDMKFVSEEYLKTSKNCLLNSGDFIFADTSEDFEGSGNFSYLNSNSQVFAGYHTVIACLKSKQKPRFFAYIFDSNAHRKQIQTQVKGIKVFSITQGILKDIYSWLPPVHEQDLIVEYLDNECKKISLLKAKQIELIEKLKEYRSSIISHAVTGKIDVREFGA